MTTTTKPKEDHVAPGGVSQRWEAPVESNQARDQWLKVGVLPE